MFRNRQEAGEALARQLLHYRETTGIVLAIPRGGVPIGAAISAVLGWPLDLALSKKIGHPQNQEWAIGAVSMKAHVLNENIDVPREYIEKEIARIREKIHNDYDHYMRQKGPLNLSGKTVILTDDGVATGYTLLAVIGLILSEKPLKLQVAVPVAAPRALPRIAKAADELLCLQAPEDFRAVGQFYENFDQLTDLEVTDLLEKRRI